MSCEDCEAKQETNMSAWFRWDKANIEIRGCDKHLREVFNVLRFWQNVSREGKVNLLLHPDSWQNLFDCIRKSSIKSEGNFWAAIQEIERQFKELNYGKEKESQEENDKEGQEGRQKRTKINTPH